MSTFCKWRLYSNNMNNKWTFTYSHSCIDALAQFSRLVSDFWCHARLVSDFCATPYYRCEIISFPIFGLFWIQRDSKDEEYEKAFLLILFVWGYVISREHVNYVVTWALNLISCCWGEEWLTSLRCNNDSANLSWVEQFLLCSYMIKTTYIILCTRTLFC